MVGVDVDACAGGFDRDTTPIIAVPAPWSLVTAAVCKPLSGGTLACRCMAGNAGSLRRLRKMERDLALAELTVVVLAFVVAFVSVLAVVGALLLSRALLLLLLLLLCVLMGPAAFAPAGASGLLRRDFCRRLRTLAARDEMDFDRAMFERLPMARARALSTARFSSSHHRSASCVGKGSGWVWK